MKYLWLITLTLLISSCVKEDFIDDNVGKHDDNENLIAYWSFDDKNAMDETQFENHGTLAGNYSFATGISSQALRVTGTGTNSDAGGHVILPKINFEDMEEFAISMWVYEESWTTSYGGFYLSFGDQVNGWLGIGYGSKRPSDDKNYLQFAVGASNKISDNEISPDPALYYYFKNNEHQNVWMNYIISYSDKIMKTYVNGVLIGSQLQEVMVIGDESGVSRHWWQNGQWGSGTATRFTGMVDEIKIFSKALNSDEIKELSGLSRV